MARPDGPASEALVAWPPSPAYPEVPFPAYTLIGMVGRNAPDPAVSRFGHEDIPGRILGQSPGQIHGRAGCGSAISGEMEQSISRKGSHDACSIDLPDTSIPLVTR